jgi:hypothetical protein
MFQLLSDMLKTVARVEERLEVVVLAVEDLNHSMHGTPEHLGVAARLDLINEKMIGLEAGKTELVTLAKNHEELRQRVADYPSYLWLLRYRPKQTLITTMVVGTLLALFLSPLLETDAKVVWYRVCLLGW